MDKVTKLVDQLNEEELEMLRLYIADKKITKRMPGELTTVDTRHDSNIRVDRQKRYKQILECFREHPKMTAKECAVEMQRKGYIPTSERNFTAPRMTEMTNIGIIEPIGKKTCDWTGKTVAVYGLRL